MRLTSILITGIYIFNAMACSIYGATNENNQKPTVIIVVGAKGTSEYGKQFAKWAELWKETCLKGNADYTIIGLDTIEDSNDFIILQETINNEPKEIETALWLVLIGHGTFDGRSAKFNLRGPDLSAENLFEWLKPFHRPVIIINNASSVAFKGVKDRAAYTASKGAVLSMTRAMAVDYLEDKIRVNAICPGTTDTPSLAERIKSRGGSYEEVRQQYIERQRIGRLGTPEEIAEGVLFLVVNNFCTGVSLLVDGGMTM